MCNTFALFLQQSIILYGRRAYIELNLLYIAQLTLDKKGWQWTERFRLPGVFQGQHFPQQRNTLQDEFDTRKSYMMQFIIVIRFIAMNYTSQSWFKNFSVHTNVIDVQNNKMSYSVILEIFALEKFI